MKLVAFIASSTHFFWFEKKKNLRTVWGKLTLWQFLFNQRPDVYHSNRFHWEKSGFFIVSFVTHFSYASSNTHSALVCKFFQIHLHAHFNLFIDMWNWNLFWVALSLWFRWTDSCSIQCYSIDAEQTCMDAK